MVESFFDTVNTVIEMAKKNDIIKEEKYKQILFQKLLIQLGYDEKEIEFEVPIKGDIEGQVKRIFNGTKKADIVCEDILFEIKSSNIILNDGSVLNQALEYNKILSKKIICISNFIDFQVYNIEGENICNLNLINTDICNVDVLLFQSLGKQSVFKGKKVNSFSIIEEEYNRFQEDKKKIEKILNFINLVSQLSLDNDFEILPVADINFNVGLDWKENISREPWVEIFDKISFESKYSNINKQILKIKEIIRDLSECFPLKYFSENDSYALKPKMFETDECRRSYKNYFRENLLLINKISNKIESELKCMSKLLSNIYGYWHGY